MAKTYADCWDAFNTRAWDKFKACYNADATSETVDQGKQLKGADAIVEDAKGFVSAFSDAHGEIQLTLVSDNHVVGVVLVTGTNDGPLKSKQGDMPPTKKKISLLMAHVIDIDPKTKVASGEWSFFDALPMMAQLGVIKMQLPDAEPLADKGKVIVAKGDATEKANMDSHHAALDAWNKHDIKALMATRSDDVKWYEGAAPHPLSEQELAGSLEAMWKQFPDSKMTPAGESAVGDYVIHFGEMSGSSGGKAFKVKYFNVQHYKDAKVDAGWLFYNSLAMAQQLGVMPK